MACPNEEIGNGDVRRLGIAVSDIILEPSARRRLYPAWKHLFRA